MPERTGLPMDCPAPCGTCEPVFDRIVVNRAVRVAARVSWALLDTFTDASPLTFQLQVADTSNPNAEWADVGLPVTDRYFAIDDQFRAFGGYSRTYYRVKLTTGLGEYLSAPVGTLGVLDLRDWAVAREIVRQRLQDYRVGFAGQRGWLLKMRVTGELCPVCLDPVTRECLDPSCPTCCGTGRLCGYYYPVSCVWAKFGPQKRGTRLDPQRGTITETIVPAEMVLTDMLDDGDVFVSERTDDRYYVHPAGDIERVRAVPLVSNVELRQIPFTSHIYKIDIPEQTESLWIA